MWQQWLNILVGLWIIASTYLGFSSDTMVLNLTISGVIVSALALWGALDHNAMMSEDRMHRHA